MTLTEQQKVQRLYSLIGDRGLYVNTNYDVFTKPPEEIPIIGGVGYKVPLIQPGSKAYASPLLFATLTSLLNHGTMLLTGAPGIGKTTSVEYAGRFFMNLPLEDILAAEILGNPQLKTEDIVASLDTVAMVHEGKKIVLPTKFVQSSCKIWDEINRTPADGVSAAMKLIDTGKVVYQGTLIQSPPGPFFATANYSDEGTFQLTPPLLDRFDVAVMVTSPQPWDLQKIRARGDEKINGNLEELLKIPKELELYHERIRNEIREIQEEQEHGVGRVSNFADFIYSSLRFAEVASNTLARATKGNAWQTTQDNAPPGHFMNAAFVDSNNELSVRTAKAMLRYAKAFAWFNGREKVEVEDLKRIAPYLLWHKLQPTQSALTVDPKYANDRIAFVESVLQKIEGEYNEVYGSDIAKWYGSALQALRTGKIGDTPLEPDEKRRLIT